MIFLIGLKFDPMSIGTSAAPMQEANVVGFPHQQLNSD